MTSRPDDTPPVFDAAEPGVPDVSEQPSPPLSPPGMAPATPAQLARVRRPARGSVPGAGARSMVLGWCLWLLGTWTVMLPAQGPVWAVRGMIVSALVGLMALWPMVRLSQGSAPAEPGGPLQHGRTTLGVLVEWLSLMAVFQAVIWPLRVTGNWGLEQTLWLDAAVAAWSLLAAAVLAMGLRSQGSLGRSAAMGLCLLLLLGEGVWASVLPWPILRVSPLPTVWSFTVPEQAWRRQPGAAQVIVTAVAALVAWAVVLLTLRRAAAPDPARRDAIP